MVRGPRPGPAGELVDRGCYGMHFPALWQKRGGGGGGFGGISKRSGDRDKGTLVL